MIDRNSILKCSDFPFNKIKPPCFLYNLDIIRETIKELKERMSKNVELYYSMKANPIEDIIKQIRKTKTKIEVTSKGEINLALSIGYKPEEMIFTGPGKIIDEIYFAINLGIDIIVLESLSEARVINNIARLNGKKQKVLIRISPSNLINHEKNKGFALFGSIPVKYGIDEEDIHTVIKNLMTLNNVDIQGFHVFNASGILNYQIATECIKQTFNLVKNIKDNFKINIISINFGGGLGVSYDDKKKFNLKLFCKNLNKLISDFCYEDIKLFFELGTFIVAKSGYYISEIIDTKISRGKKIIIVNGGIHHLLRISLVGNHSLDFIYYKKINSKSIRYKYDIFGNLCHPLDILGRDIVINIMVNFTDLIGNFIIFYNCGAYGENFAVKGFSKKEPARIYT